MSSPNSSNHGKGISVFKGLMLVFILLLPTAIYFFFSTGKHNIISLPYYGNKEPVTITENGKERTDTIYHKVGSFSFVNQEGKTITEKTFDGKIYVADFFFVTCPTICPKMSAQMLRVQDRFKDNPSVMFLSHTVNPEHDTVEVLADYAKKVHADNSKWHFLTGDKQEIYKQALYSYLVNASEDVLAPEGFLHSEMFVLIDKNKHIRGFYDGTDLKDVDRLMDEIKVLIAEEMVPRKNKSEVHD